MKHTVLLPTTILLISTLATANLGKTDYINQITEKVHSEWKLVKAKGGWTCKVDITQDEEGNILDSNISACNTKDKRFISQLQKAVNNSSPLPKAPDGLFSSTITIYPRIKGDIDVFKEIKRRYKDGDPIAVKFIRDLRGSFHRKRRNEDTLGELRRMYKDGNPVAIEVIESMKKLINKSEEQ